MPNFRNRLTPRAIAVNNHRNCCPYFESKNLIYTVRTKVYSASFSKQQKNPPPADLQPRKKSTACATLAKKRGTINFPRYFTRVHLRRRDTRTQRSSFSRYVLTLRSLASQRKQLSLRDEMETEFENNCWPPPSFLKKSQKSGIWNTRSF